MLEIINQSHDPFFNLALEEYLLNRRDIKEDIFLLWQNRPVVVVGRNQNTLEEINLEYIRTHNIEVVRRISGGGAVYHDLGNLNFTFIADERKSATLNFTRFTAPVIQALAQIGIKAENQGRNDITIEGKKFSGNAQCIMHGRVMHHGTILFDTNMKDMQEALNVDQDKIASKGVKSVRSRVTNIKDYLSEPISIEEFKEILSSTIDQNREIRELTPTELAAVNALRENKYLRWEWVYGSSPPFNVHKSARFDWGKIDFRIDVKKGIIANCKIYGDFFTTGTPGLLEQALIGIPYRQKDLHQALESINISTYIPGANLDDILALLI